jgi:hypothetical protein
LIPRVSGSMTLSTAMVIKGNFFITPPFQPKIKDGY